jgi:hypothetical protein
MSEEETRAKEQRPRIAKLSVLSLLLSVLGFCLSTIFPYIVNRFIEALVFSGEPLTWVRSIPFFYIFLFTALFVSILSLIIGLIVLNRIETSNGLLSGYIIVYTGLFIATLTISWACFMLFVGLLIGNSWIGPSH